MRQGCQRFCWGQALADVLIALAVPVIASSLVKADDRIPIERSTMTQPLDAAGSVAPAPDPAPVQAPGALSLDGLAGMSSDQLDALYRQGSMAGMPAGKVRGLALYPDARFSRARSRAARVAWQGKVFRPESGTAVNRFFGLKVIEGRVYSGNSWLDGGPALILDYEGTSKVYNNYRDEIRQIGPGLYLGQMYDRTTNPPTFKMYFAFADEG